MSNKTNETRVDLKNLTQEQIATIDALDTEIQTLSNVFNAVDVIDSPEARHVARSQFLQCIERIHRRLNDLGYTDETPGEFSVESVLNRFREFNRDRIATEYQKKG